MIDVSRVMGPGAYTPTFSVTDPEPVRGPAAPTEVVPTRKKNDALGRDEFLQLLVAQMKNQDPLSPMDGQEMAAQLAQFSQVEQLLDIKASLQTVAANQAELGVALEDLSQITLAQGDAMARLLEQSMAINTVGRTGVLEGDQLFVDRDGSGTITIDSTVEGAGTLRVRDADGVLVATGHAEITGEGMQSIDLETFAFDPPLPPGRYSFSLGVTDDRGRVTPAQTYTTGRITGLRSANGAPALVIGDSLTVPFTSLIQLRR
jgi:flagellar basal-body rod modification protein FlgD